jgi:hypothetical protein
MLNASSNHSSSLRLFNSININAKSKTQYYMSFDLSSNFYIQSNGFLVAFD